MKQNDNKKSPSPFLYFKKAHMNLINIVLKIMAILTSLVYRSMPITLPVYGNSG